MNAGKWYYEVTLHSNSTNGSRFGWGLLGDAVRLHYFLACAFIGTGRYVV
jgi:hypothetical protein